MNIHDESFHDSTIIKIIEYPNQIIDYYIDYPTDWENNLFEPRILRFNGVIFHKADLIAFDGTETILEIKDQEITKNSKLVDNENMIIIATNAGNRELIYKNCQLLNTFDD